MLYRPLGSTGLKVSVLSYGASPLGNAFRTIDDNEGIRTVRTALDLGINFLDTSPHYGVTKSETVLGQALKGVPRDSYYLATKVGQYGEGHFDFSAARVTQSFNESCARLGTDYIYVLHCHDIEFADLNQIVNETLPALVKLRDAGRVGHLGVTGLPLKIFPAIIDRVAPGIDVLFLDTVGAEAPVAVVRATQPGSPAGLDDSFWLVQRGDVARDPGNSFD